MPSLNALRARLGLPDRTPDADFQTVEDAVARVPDAPPFTVRDAALALLAREGLANLPGSLELMAALMTTLQSSRPERELARLLAVVTGGQAEIHASWGDVIAHSGTPRGELMQQRLVYEGRHVGTLSLTAEPQWRPLLLLAAEFARLARLQAAAAAAARRRVGERALEALLAGDASGTFEPEPCALGALSFATPPPRTERGREARTQALDVLCAVGEGYFRERGLRCFTTVRGDKALWLWHSHDAEREARDLHAALCAATDADFRLGVSGQHDGYEHAAAALHQALQALAEARQAREFASFLHGDPLHALLGSEALAPLCEQVHARLAPVDADGKIEATLRAFLAHPGSIGELAARLNIHVNTLRYRLRRAEEALGQSLAEPAVIARLFLALNADPDRRPGAGSAARPATSEEHVAGFNRKNPPTKRN